MSETGKVTVTTPSDREITLAREFEAPRELVFEAWTTPDILKKWLFGPEGHSLETCEIDLRVGGKLRYVWRMPDGSTMGMSGEYREISPPERIVHTEIFDQDWTGGETDVTNEFVEECGRTRVTVTVRYSSKEARDAALKTPMAEGMEMGYVRLEKLLASAPAR